MLVGFDYYIMESWDQTVRASKYIGGNTSPILLHILGSKTQTYPRLHSELVTELEVEQRCDSQSSALPPYYAGPHTFDSGL